MDFRYFIQERETAKMEFTWIGENNTTNHFRK